MNHIGYWLTVAAIVSRVAFTLLVALVAIERLAEFVLGRRNQARLRRLGAVEHAAWQASMLAVLHGAWLLSMVAEVWLLQRTFEPRLALLATAVFLVGQALRLRAMWILDDRWTVAVMTLSSTRPITHGPYSWLRRPNDIGTTLEIASLPLIHGAFVTAVVFSVLSAVAMALQIGVESRGRLRPTQPHHPELDSSIEEAI